MLIGKTFVGFPGLQWFASGILWDRKWDLWGEWELWDQADGWGGICGICGIAGDFDVEIVEC
jgi:hypothetical protein